MLSRKFGRKGQRGVFGVMTAVVLLMSLLFLVLALDTGRLYMEQRKLQKVADTAALESVSRLEDGQCFSAPDKAEAYARDNALRYGFPRDSGQSMTVQCASIEIEDGLRRPRVNEDGHAVLIRTQSRVPASLILRLQNLFSGAVADSLDLTAVAVAERETPTAAFTVGSQLLRLDNQRLLGQLLRTVGVSPDRLTVLDADGLASAEVTPAGLLRALGIKVGIQELKALSPKGLVDLVNAEVGLLGVDRIIGVSAELVGDSVLRAQLEALRQDILHADLRDVRVRLFGSQDEPGILSLNTRGADSLGSALDARIHLSSLLSTSIMAGVAERDRGLVIHELNLLGQTVELGIVEPPSIGVGPVGTQAYNAQVRLYIDVDTDALLGGLLRPLTALLGTRVHLPIWVDVVTGRGTLEEIRCSGEKPTVDIQVESRIANVCIGKLPDELKWSGAASCEQNLRNEELIRLLHLSVLTGKTNIPAIQHDDWLYDMAVGDTLSTEPNALALGNTVDGVVGGLLDLLSGLFRKPDDENLNYSDEAHQKQVRYLAKSYLKESALPGGAYHVDSAINLILNGSTELGQDGQPLIAPLVLRDWNIPKSIPKSCLLTTCPQSMWDDGTFSEAFKAYSLPHGILDLLGVSTLPHGLRSCGGLLSALLAWNDCTESNLAALLSQPEADINPNITSDGNRILDPGVDEIQCSSTLCLLLRPVVNLVKPILNGVGGLLDTVLADVLGLELGRTDVTVDAIQCGAPRLVR